MDYLRQVQRAIDYIEDHLDEEIALAEISAVAGVSHWHFQRMFRALTQETLRGYIRSRRLSRARLQLLEGDRPVLDIALSAGFSSQSSFTRAFTRHHGCPPARLRASRRSRVPLAKERMDEAYVRHLRDRVSLQPTLRDAPVRHLVGLPSRLSGMEAERNRIGHLLQPLWDRFLLRVGELPGRIRSTALGVIRTADPDQLEYVAAVEVPGPPPAVPRGMAYVCVPAATWAIFSHRGATKDLDRTVNYVYACWLLQSGRAHSYGPDLEVYDERFVPGSEDSIVDYAIPLR